MIQRYSVLKSELELAPEYQGIDENTHTAVVLESDHLAAIEAERAKVIDLVREAARRGAEQMERGHSVGIYNHIAKSIVFKMQKEGKI